MHRLRAVLPFLYEFDWEPTVLAANAGAVHVPQDPWLEDGIQSSLEVHRARALGLAWSVIPGLGMIDFRAMGAMRRMGSSLLAGRRFDLIYFSTTAFSLHVLGPYWKSRTGVPFAMDYQDLWVSDYYKEHPQLTPPGGRIKHRIIDRLHRYQEPRVLRECLGITSVSPAYPQQLSLRYPWLKNLPSKIIPFPGISRDIERIRRSSIAQSLFSPEDGFRHWVYVGRGGDDIAAALSGFFDALARWGLDNPAEFAKTRLHFIGTSYAPQGRGGKTVLPIAKKFGVESIVSEVSDRVRYSVMLQCLLDADALIIPGSDDPAYTASKLFPYLLARKPLLAVFHKSSSVVDLMAKLGAGILATFDQSTSVRQLSQKITQMWFDTKRYNQVTALDEGEFEPYTDRGSAKQLCHFFDEIVNSRVQDPL